MGYNRLDGNVCNQVERRAGCVGRGIGDQVESTFDYLICFVVREVPKMKAQFILMLDKWCTECIDIFGVNARLSNPSGKVCAMTFSRSSFGRRLNVIVILL